jgi:hypothetical protein
MVFLGVKDAVVEDSVDHVLSSLNPEKERDCDSYESLFVENFQSQMLSL